MKKNADMTYSSGGGFGGLLFIVFLILKLTGTITWSWWWVTAPLWFGFVLMLTVLSVIVITVGLVYLCAGLVKLIKG